MAGGSTARPPGGWGGLQSWGGSTLLPGAGEVGAWPVASPPAGASLLERSGRSSPRSAPRGERTAPRGQQGLQTLPGGHRPAGHQRGQRRPAGPVGGRLVEGTAGLAGHGHTDWAEQAGGSEGLWPPRCAERRGQKAAGPALDPAPQHLCTGPAKPSLLTHLSWAVPRGRSSPALTSSPGPRTPLQGSARPPDSAESLQCKVVTCSPRVRKRQVAMGKGPGSRSRRSRRSRGSLR